MRRDVFQAIADPTRRQIINLIAHHELNLNAVADHFEVSRPAISQHMKILLECGLVAIKQQGRERYCSIRPEPLEEVALWVEQYRQMWEERYTRLDGVLDMLKKEEASKTRKKKKH